MEVQALESADKGDSQAPSPEEAAAKDDPTESLLAALDSLERRVESMRNQAICVENEKDSLLRSLHQFQFNPGLLALSEGAQEDIKVNSERLVCRCLTVEVEVITPRNRHQEEALKKVHDYLNTLESRVKNNLEKSYEEVMLFLNACLSSDGPVHVEFQKALLSCTGDDQKKAKSKLQFWEQSLKQANGRFKADS